MAIKGLDISSQTDKIDINKIKENNIEFIMLRAGFTDYNKGKTRNTDTDFEENYKLAKKYKLNMGVYYESRAVTIEEAKEEIDYFLNIIKSKVFEYPVVLQFEDDHNTIIYYPQSQKNIDKNDLLNITIFMINEIESKGYQTLVRTYENWYEDKFEKSNIFNYWIDNLEIINSKYSFYSNKDDIVYYNISDLSKNKDKVQIIVKENCLFQKIKSYIKAGYKILKSKIGRD
ncbi:MAG: hypothetical protein J6J17_02670 [Bacilli bacterium]|nr:hypothetical protein [Bacilli bacterium]